MAETKHEYSVVIVDPDSGRSVTKTISGPKDLSSAEQNQLAAFYAERAGLKPENVSVSPVGGKSTKGKETTAQGVVTTIGEAAPYAALGLIPESAPAALTGRAGLQAIAKWLAANPKKVGAILRTLGASGIGGTEAAVKAKDVGSAATGSGIVQAGLESGVGLGFKLAARLGGRSIRKFEDQVAERLMQRVKNAVPWFKDLANSHEGLHELISTNAGENLLAKHFGEAVQEVKSSIPRSLRVTLPAEEAVALNLPKSSMEPVLPKAWYGKEITVEEAMGMGLPVKDVTVPVHTLIEKVSDPTTAQRVMPLIERAIPPGPAQTLKEAVRIFGEGDALTKTLQASRVIDEGTHRLSIERLSLSRDARTGAPGQAGKGFWQRYLSSATPEAEKVLQDVTPPGPAPRALRTPRISLSPFGHMYAGEHAGTQTAASAIKNLQPSKIFYSEGVPLSGTEEAVKKWLPGAIHSLTTGVGLTP